MSLLRSQPAGSRAVVHLLLVLLCLTITVEGAHVCSPEQHDAPGLQCDLGAQAPFCTVCAIAHSLLATIILLLLLLIPILSHPEIVPIQAQAFWDGLRLSVRPPPALL